MGLTDGRKAPHPGMCLTIGWDGGRGPQQALEGNIRAAGSTLRWISKLFGISSEEAAGDRRAKQGLSASSRHLTVSELHGGIPGHKG